MKHSKRAETSELRPLPAGWRWVRLGEVAQYINGRAFKPSEWSTSGVPIIRIQNLNSREAPYNFYEGELEDRYKVGDGDLLVSWSASLDAFIWMNGPAVLNQHIFKVIEDKRVVTREYLYFSLKEAMSEIRSQVHGATMRHITKPEFENINILLPPLPEQKRIAAILNEQMAAVDKVRDAVETQQKAAGAISSSYLRNYFDCVEARGWPLRSFGDVVELLPAKSISSDGDTEVSAITTACLTEEGFDPSGIKSARMWAKDAVASAVSQGEILIARSNTPELVGRVAMYDGVPPVVVASDLTIRLFPRQEVLSSFLVFYLSYLYLTGYWKERAGGASGTMKKITRTQLLEERIPVPSSVEQRRIVGELSNRIASCAGMRRTVKENLAAINALPAALLRRAFNGEL